MNLEIPTAYLTINVFNSKEQRLFHLAHQSLTEHFG